MTIVQTSKAYYPFIGGIESVVQTLSEGLVRRGCIVRVVVCQHHPSLITSQESINGVPVKYSGSFGTLYSLPMSPSYFWELKKEKGDILHIHLPFPLADLSVVLSSSIRSHFSAIVATWHSDIVRQRIVMPAYRPFLKRFLEYVDLVMVSNPNLLKNSPYLQEVSKKCKVVPFGFSYAWTEQSKERAGRVHSLRSLYSPFVLFVGRLVYYKGVSYLIRAMRDIKKDVKLVIIGDGPLKSELVCLSQELNVCDRVIFLPPQPSDDLYAYYEACELLVLPSISEAEAYGIVQLEAMACGKPVVSTELGTGTSFVNQNGITGLVVPPKNSAELAAAVNDLLENDSLRRTMGNHARARILSEFTEAQMITKTINCYTEILSSKRI